MNHLVSLALDQARVHAIILLDPKGTIVGWMGGAETHLGYSAREIVGRSVSIIFVPEDVARGAPELEREIALKSGESTDDRWQLRKDGARIFATGAMIPVFDGEQLAGFVKVLRDRTDIKTHFETLERQVAFEQERNDRKNAFISTLAHDLRNPLLTLRLSIELLRETGPSGEDAERALLTMEQETEFIRRMIDNLLENTRSAAGKVQLRKTHLVFQEFVEAVVARFQPTPQRLQLLMQESPIEIDVDPIRMRQVVSNLVDNAIKHTPVEGQITVKVYAEAEDAVLRVEDSGRGIAPGFLKHIFDLFTQAEPAGESTAGLGLGLSIVKDAVTMHGGTVQALSDGVGKGSAFIVRIPMGPPVP
jgi:two-component system CheB/CheR fusion protein